MLPTKMMPLSTTARPTALAFLNYDSKGEVARGRGVHVRVHVAHWSRLGCTPLTSSSSTYIYDLISFSKQTLTYPFDYCVPQLFLQASALGAEILSGDGDQIAAAAALGIT